MKTSADEVDVPINPTLRIHNAHPQSQILGDPNTHVQTRSSLKKITSNHKDQQHCLFACFLSQSEPRKVLEALEDKSWVEAMQEELNKKDERGVVVRNKARLVAQGHRQEEGFLKRRNLVLTDSEDEEPKAQGRKSHDDPQ
ncbi:hypothetical protein Tco_0171903, partial [Tanacetum coccineum]